MDKKIPTDSLTDKQKDLLREFSKEGSEEQRPHESSWFDKVKRFVDSIKD